MELLEAKCRYCESRLVHFSPPFKARNGKTFRLGTCDCGAVSLAPRPTGSELAEAYDESYYGEGETKFPKWIERFIEYFRKSRARQIAKLLPNGGRVLDIGCGNGKFLGHLAELGFECHGMELPGKSAERAKQISGISVKTKPLMPEDFPEHYFDIVTMWHVFEHLDAPNALLDVSASILRPGGTLVMSLPNIDSWQARIFKGNWFHLDPPRHLFFMGPERLIAKIEQRGFACLAARFWSLEQNPFGVQQSLLNVLGFERDELYEQLKGNRDAKEKPSHLKWFNQLYFFLSMPPAVLLAGLESLAGSGGTMELIFRKR